MAKDSPLAAYLKDRRTKLDPAAFGFACTRRRTPGLRREEVAQRANVSATWYTWLEQGRGGVPSAEVLERLAEALTLTEVERDHLFVLATGRPAAPRHELLNDITPRLQRVLDCFEYSPAMVKNCAWDVVAWNKAATVIFPPYNSGEFKQRNILKHFFSNTETRHLQHDWETVARFVVAAFRADAARAGFDVTPMVQELSELSPEFKAMWSENSVQGHESCTKKMRHPQLGLLEFDYCVFAVDGRTDLSMAVYTPTNEADKEKVKSLLTAAGGKSVQLV